jgi:putative tricarboxylic transport membrane protein
MITSICMNIPGESTSVVTTFDGYPLAKNGKAGKAMGIAALSSFVGGTVGLVLLTVIGVPLARWALHFGPPEYMSIYIFTFIAILSLGGGDTLKSAISLFLGFLIASVGIDPITGGGRLTFGSVDLLAGIGFLPVIVGMFGLSEIVLDIASNESASFNQNVSGKEYGLKEVFPSLSDFIHCFPSMIRGCLLGFFIGALPGPGGSLSTFMSYGIEKRLSKDPDSFGKGNIRGVAAPEASNNGCCSGAYVPLLALGIPGTATAAMLLGAFILLGIQPGPRLFVSNPQLVWGIIASMYVGNVVLLVLNTAFIPVFIWLLKKSQNTLPVIVAILCFIGSYSLNNSFFDIFLMLLFTGFGVFFKKLSIPAAPAVIAVVLGGNLEFSFRQTMELFRGHFFLTFERPICVALFILSAMLILLSAYKNVKAKAK